MTLFVLGQSACFPDFDALKLQGGAGGRGGMGGGTGGTPDANGTGGGTQRADAAADAASDSRTDGRPNDAGLDVRQDAPSDARQRDVAFVEAGCGNGGYALSFDGTAYATIPRPVQDDFTFEAWIKTTITLHGSWFFQGSAFLYADIPVAGANDFGTTLLNDKFAAFVGSPDTSIMSTSTVATGEWTHIAATRSRTSGRLQVFVNGIMESEALGSSRALTDPPAITLGGAASGNNYTGLVDEVRIWNYVRTESQIASAMYQQLASDEPGLVGYYRFDEGRGSLLIDNSLNANHAPITGTVTWVASDSPVCPRPDAGADPDGSPLDNDGAAAAPDASDNADSDGSPPDDDGPAAPADAADNAD